MAEWMHHCKVTRSNLLIPAGELCDRCGMEPPWSVPPTDVPGAFEKGMAQVAASLAAARCAACNGTQTHPGPAGGWLRCTKCLPQGVTLALAHGVAACRFPFCSAANPAAIDKPCLDCPDRAAGKHGVPAVDSSNLPGGASGGSSC